MTRDRPGELCGGACVAVLVGWMILLTLALVVLMWPRPPAATEGMMNTPQVRTGAARESVDEAPKGSAAAKETDAPKATQEDGG